MSEYCGHGAHKDKCCGLCAQEKAPSTIKVVGNDVLQEIIEEAHMAGQANAGADPSFSNAQAYYKYLFK